MCLVKLVPSLRQQSFCILGFKDVKLHVSKIMLFYL